MEFHRFNYLDASVLVKLVIQERGTEAIKPYLKEARSTTFYAIVPCFIEALSALKLKYRRKEIDEATYCAACDDLGYYTCVGGLIELENVDISDSSVFWQVEKIVK
jgi:predicted nucleic acid-binding protein